ncbi:MAG: hypothetical protein JOS17DRAFT_577404 [Linnemannia elongata]|nr:MAG: hypothetical protein JOS17DRAFT_577404 [Linnemannia elongata]
MSRGPQEEKCGVHSSHRHSKIPQPYFCLAKVTPCLGASEILSFVVVASLSLTLTLSLSLSLFVLLSSSVLFFTLWSLLWKVTRMDGFMVWSSSPMQNFYRRFVIFKNVTLHDKKEEKRTKEKM